MKLDGRIRNGPGKNPLQFEEDPGISISGGLLSILPSYSQVFDYILLSKPIEGETEISTVYVMPKKSGSIQPFTESHLSESLKRSTVRCSNTPQA